MNIKAMSEEFLGLVKEAKKEKYDKTDEGEPKTTFGWHRFRTSPAAGAATKGTLGAVVGGVGGALGMEKLRQEAMDRGADPKVLKKLKTWKGALGGGLALGGIFAGASALNRLRKRDLYSKASIGRARKGKKGITEADRKLLHKLRKNEAESKKKGY